MSFVRSFFSGVESQQHFDMARDAGCQHMLMSYLYVSKQGTNILEERKLKYPHLKFMIDSGAHTLQKSMDKAPYKTWKLKDFEDYVQAYARFLDQNRKHIFCAVELDVAYSVNIACGKSGQDPYGDAVIDRWRKDIFMPLQASGVNICFVWHPSQGFDGWEKMCSEFPYVGLPGEMSNNNDFMTYMAVAKRYLTKVHGFAATKHSDYKEHPWYSIDSITWKAGEIYGTLPIWDERRQHYKLYDAGPEHREQFRHVFESQGLDANKIINDLDYKEVTRSALKSMASMEQFYKERFKNVIQYYELRLPVPAAIARVSERRLRFWFKKRFSAEKNFPHHCHTKDVTKLRTYLHALSCIEYRTLHLLTPKGKEFLAAYFPLHINNPLPDSAALLKEFAVLVSPGNEVARRRETAEDYMDTSNPPKRRAIDFSEFDIVDDINMLALPDSEI